MKYSIIVPLFDRYSHVKTLIPALHDKFKGTDYEIIISQQNDSNIFRIACVQNIGAQVATGEIFVINHADFVPTEDVTYNTNESLIGKLPAVLIPHRRAIFLDINMNPRDISDIPPGYRNWHVETDENFFGGSIVIPRHYFEVINGYNPLYIGWGSEDEDLRERIRYYNVPVMRNSVGTFNILYHEDSHPKTDDMERYQNFINGKRMLNNYTNYLNVGHRQLSADISVDTIDKNTKWVKSTNFSITSDDIKSSIIDFSSL